MAPDATRSIAPVAFLAAAIPVAAAVRLLLREIAFRRLDDSRVK